MPRRALLAGTASALGTLLAARWARAEDIPVPLLLQVELLSKVVSYDRNFALRVRDLERERVQVLVLTESGDSASTRVARRLQAAFTQVERLGPFSHDLSVHPFEGASKLTKYCQEHSIDIVYVTPQLENELPQIVAALTGLDLISVSVSPVLVPKRLVLGFDLVSGRPKILVHLGQARLQNVAFRSEFLKLARVYP